MGVEQRRECPKCNTENIRRDFKRPQFCQSCGIDMDANERKKFTAKITRVEPPHAMPKGAR